MYIFKVHGKDYRVRFTYRTICKSNILDKISQIGDFDGESAKGVINQLVVTTAEMLLEGLQKYHSDEFGYKNDEERDARIDDILDLFDDYEDEATEENPQSASTLLTDLQRELEKNGFLSALQTATTEAEEAEQMAQDTLKEMEEKPARTKVIDMTPTESES